VSHASVHAAVLSRLCGAATSATLGVAAIGLAEQARQMLAEHVSLLSWLVSPGPVLPVEHRASSSADLAGTTRLREALGPSAHEVPGLELGPTRSAALLMVLFACGLRQSAQLQAAIVSARLPLAIAEAMAQEPVAFLEYPIDLPRFRYEAR
jgi:hypothetical protein